MLEQAEGGGQTRKRSFALALGTKGREGEWFVDNSVNSLRTSLAVTSTCTALIFLSSSAAPTYGSALDYIPRQPQIAAKLHSFVLRGLQGLEYSIWSWVGPAEPLQVSPLGNCGLA